MTRFLHSHSGNERFNTCPASFQLMQTGAPRGEMPPNFGFGITAHLVMEKYVNHCVNSGRRSDITVIGQFIDEAVRETGMSLQQYDELTIVVRAFLKTYEIDVEHSIAREGGIAFDDDLNLIEWSGALEYSNLTKPVDQKGRVFWRSKLDHVMLIVEEKTLVIQDYKTDIFVPSQSAIEQASSRFYQQAREYAWAAWRALFHADLVRVDFIFMRYCAYGKAMKRSITFNRDEIIETQELLLAKAQFIEATQEFIAIPGDHCINCPFRETACPVASEIETAEPATIMRQWLKTRVDQDARREKLKEHVAEYGYEGGLGPLRAAFEQVEERIADMRRVWLELVDAGCENPWALMKFSPTDAKGLVDKDTYERLMKAAYDPAIGVKFNVHQPKEVLVALCEARGIATMKPGKTKMVNRTVAELAWDLAQQPDEPGEQQQVSIPAAAAAEVSKQPEREAGPFTSEARTADLNLVDLDTISEVQ